MYTQRLRRGYKVNFTDCYFPEFVTLTNGNQSFRRCTLKGAQEVAPGGSTYKALFQECDITDKFDLPVAGKAVVVRRCNLFGTGHRIGGASALNSKEQEILIEDNYCEMSGTDAHFMAVYAPAWIRGNRCNYVGTSDSSNSWFNIFGRSGASATPVRVDSNMFDGATNTVASALRGNTANVSLTTDGQNTVHRAFATGWGINLAALGGAAPTKH